MVKKLKYRMQSYPIANLSTIMPLLGVINGILFSDFETIFDFEFILGCMLLYLLMANAIRLSRIYRHIYVFDNKIEYYNMFGLKKRIVDSKIDLSKLVVIHDLNFETNKPKNFATDFKALFNFRHGGELRYKNNLIYRGLK
jgi:hypothetical protein